MLLSNLSVFILNMSVWSHRLHACSRSACGLVVWKVYGCEYLLLNDDFFLNKAPVLSNQSVMHSHVLTSPLLTLQHSPAPSA